MNKRNIILIGMPGAGKSTVGVVLAKRLGLDFLDTDLLIQRKAGCRLQEIIGTEGLPAFKHYEESILLALNVSDTVIATGGSVVYSAEGMNALRHSGPIVFLDVPLTALENRIRDMDSRGLVIDPGETLADLYRTRLPLYRHYADIIVPASELSVEETAAMAARLLDQRFNSIS